MERVHWVSIIREVMTNDGANQHISHALTKPNWLDRAFRFRPMRHAAKELCFDSPVSISEVIECIETKYRGALLAGGSNAVAAHCPVAKGELALNKGDVIEIAVQTWRLGRRVDALNADKNPREKKQFAESLARFKKILEVLKVECIDPIGQIYTDGWAEVEVVSWETPEIGDGVCKVEQTIAPIVRLSGEIIARGQVVITDVK